MTDKRRDSGEYYPGGRVIARPGTAPQQVVVQWSDVQNKPQVAPLPDRYREDDMKGKINEIASKFATVAVAALIGWTAFAGVTVHKARMGSLWNDEQIVTNVTYSAEAETDPTVPAWAKEETPPQTMTTNAVRDIASEVVAPVEVKANTALAEAGNKLPKVLSRTDKLSAENPDSLALPIPLIEYKVFDFIRPTKGWMWNYYTDFNYLRNKPTTLAGYGIMDATTKTELSSKADKVTPTAADNLATLTADGNLADSGIATNLILSLRGKQDLRIYMYGYGSRLSSDCLPVTLDGEVVSCSIGRSGYGEHDFPTLFINGEVLCTFTNEGVYDGGYDGLLFNGRSAVLGKYPYLDPASVVDFQADRIARKSDIPSISATNPIFSNAVLAVTINTIRREVSSALNTYVDGETGVEYEGKFYGGSLYYVPTGNVYPPNN